MRYCSRSSVRRCFAVTSFTFVFSTFLPSYGWFYYRFSISPGHLNTVGIIAREWYEWLFTLAFVSLVSTWVWILDSKWERVARNTFPRASFINGLSTSLPSVDILLLGFTPMSCFVVWLSFLSHPLHYKITRLFRLNLTFLASSSPRDRELYRWCLQILFFVPCFSDFSSLSNNFTISSFGQSSSGN